MDYNGDTGMGKGNEVHKVIGRSDNGHIRLYSRAYGVTHLVPGYIVQTDEHYYRVYEDGRRGLRYWCVDTEVEAEKERLGLGNDPPPPEDHHTRPPWIRRASEIGEAYVRIEAR